MYVSTTFFHIETFFTKGQLDSLARELHQSSTVVQIAIEWVHLNVSFLWEWFGPGGYTVGTVPNGAVSVPVNRELWLAAWSQIL